MPRLVDRWRGAVVALGLSAIASGLALARQSRDEPSGLPPVTAPSPNPGTQGPPDGSPKASPALPDSLPSAVRRVPSPGDDVLVVMKSEGERFEAEFVAEDAQGFRLRIAGIVVSVLRSNVERMVVLDAPRERYLQMRALIVDTDIDRLVLLSQWLQRRRLYAEAVRELSHVLLLEPTNGEAIRLMREVEQQAALAERAGDPPPEPEEPRERAAAPERPKPGDFPLLTPEQINLMKVFEVDLSDPPRMVVARETIQRLLTQHADDPLIPSTRDGREAFLKKSAPEVLDIMFRLRARDLYGQVQVLDQPRSMRLFRDHVHAAWLVNSCATTRCHGGSQAGRLQLTNYRPTAESSVYTNYLILDRFVTKDGKRLIDYEEPERSVLLQMALPRDDAAHPHPDVPGWRPAFRNRDERRYQQAVDWIASMYRPRPDLPIEYTPPGERKSAEGVPPPEGRPVER